MHTGRKKSQTEASPRLNVLPGVKMPPRAALESACSFSTAADSSDAESNDAASKDAACEDSLPLQSPGTQQTVRVPSSEFEELPLAADEETVGVGRGKDDNFYKAIGMLALTCERSIFEHQLASHHFGHVNFWATPPPLHVLEGSALC